MAIVLNNVTSGFNLSTINSNFQKIEDYVNDKLLARAATGVAGEAMMARPLDMNGNSILNVYVDVDDAGSLLTVGVADARYYNVSGDSLSGTMDVNGQPVINLPTPVVASQAVPKFYVDSLAELVEINNNKALRFPETVPEMANAGTRAMSLQGYESTGKPVPVFSMTDTADLALKLASPDGASLVGGLSYLTPEMFSGGVGVSSDYTSFIQAAISAASTGPIKNIFLGNLYKISPTGSFDIPSNVSVIGGGPGTGVVMETVPSANMYNIFNVAGTNTTLDNFSIQFNTGGLGSIGAVRAYGVFVQSTASNCSLSRLFINGKYSDTAMGFSNGIRLTGTNNSIKNCVVRRCSMGCTVRGSYLTIQSNWMDNAYTTEDGTTWNSSKPQWDGIACEGLMNSIITGNLCTNNGQSGIYFGGGGSGYSSGNLVSNNISLFNWNRGIDTGISGTQSSTNDVTNFTIIGNRLVDNRETQLWMFGTNNSTVTGNYILETSAYDTLFAGQASSSRAGLALGQSAWCVNNIIDGNYLLVRSTTPFGVVFNGTGHRISASNRFTGGASNYWFGSPVNIIYANNVERYNASFTPVLRAGSNNVSLVSGSCDYTITDNTVTYNMEVLLTGSGGTGNLYLGTLPVTAGLLLTRQSVDISYWSGLRWEMIPGSYLQGSFLVDDPAQISIVRKYGSDTINDVPSCIGVGTKLRIKATATVNTSSTSDTATGISFFGHSFLSEQGFSNSVGESLGKRVFNFARGGSSSKEAALVFGAIQNSYMPVGGVIPASGSVDLSPNEDAVWYPGSNIATVTLAGVQGTISSVNVSGITNKLVFTRSASGSAVSVPSPVPMTVLPLVRQNSWSTKSGTSHSTFKDDIVVIQCLRNNSSWGDGMNDIAAIVSSLGTTKFVILPEFYYTSETTGTAGANTVNTYNALLKSTYPNNYCEIGGVSMLQNFNNAYNPAYAQDVTDIGNGVTPGSLRYDTLHPSRYRQTNALRSGVQTNAEFVAAFIKSKGW